MTLESLDQELPARPGAGQLLQLVQAREDFLAQSKATNTLRAYRSDWRDFSQWCAEQGLQALPAEPETLSLYLSARAAAGDRAVTIQRRLSALSQAHQAAGHQPSPTTDYRVRQLMRGIRRSLGVAPVHSKAPVAGRELRRLILATPAESRAGLRDRALLLIGQLGAFRRSELVALDVDDVEQLEDGLRIRIRRSKTDQEGAGDWKGIPRRSDPDVCPVRALHAWLQVSDIESGPLWRPVNRHDQVLEERLTDKGVARILKRACARAGLDPGRYAGHSLRSGLATAAAAGGAPERAIMAQGGWRSAKTVRERYIRKSSVFQENAANWVQV